MAKTRAQLRTGINTVRNESVPAQNSKARIADLIFDLLNLVPAAYDPDSPYEPGQYVIFNGRYFRAFGSVDSGQSPEDNPELWEDSATNGQAQIADRVDKLATARDVADYVDARAQQILTAPGGLNINAADETVAGIAPRSSQTKVEEGTDNVAFVTASLLRYALTKALQGLTGYGLNDATTIDPVTGNEVTINNRANIKVVRLLQSLEVIDRAEVQYVLTQTENGTIAKTPIGAVVAMAIGASYNPTTHALNLAAQNAVGDVKYSIALMNVVSNPASQYTVPAELRSGAVTLVIIGDTPTQTAKTELKIPADPLGNVYINAAFVVRNPAGPDGVSTVSHYLKGKGPGMTYKVTGRNGTVVPVAIAGVIRNMTAEEGGYQKPGLFSGVAPFAGIDIGCGNGDYTVTYAVTDHPDISLTFNYTLSDTQSQLVLYQNNVVEQETVPKAPVLNSVVITIGTAFSVLFPPFANAPAGSVYSTNVVVTGATFNSSDRTLRGNVPEGSEAELDCEYYCITPAGKVYPAAFHLSIVADNTPKIEKALGFFNDTGGPIVGYAAHDILIKTRNQPAGTKPQVGLRVTNAGNPGGDIYWFDTSPFSDASDYKWQHVGTASPFFLAGSIIEYYFRLTPAATAILFYSRDIADTPANRAQAIINYPSIAGGGAGGSSGDMDALLGAVPAYTRTQVAGTNSNSAQLDLVATLGPDGLLTLNNRKAIPVPAGYKRVIRVNGVPYAGYQDPNAKFATNMPLGVEEAYPPSGQNDVSQWFTQAANAPGLPILQGSVTYFKA